MDVVQFWGERKVPGRQKIGARAPKVRLDQIIRSEIRKGTDQRKGMNRSEKRKRGDRVHPWRWRPHLLVAPGGASDDPASTTTQVCISPVLCSTLCFFFLCYSPFSVLPALLHPLHFFFLCSVLMTCLDSKKLCFFLCIEGARGCDITWADVDEANGASEAVKMQI